MTFVVGMRCSDGIVLCTDSLEDDTITKNTVDKIRVMGTTAWGLAISGSGPGSTLDKFGATISAKVTSGQFDPSQVEAEVENELAEFNSKYVHAANDQFHVIVGWYNQSKIERSLYKGSCFGQGQGVVLSPIRDECHAGMGNELWRFLADMLYDKRNSVADNVRLAVFATRLAIKYAAGVDEPVQPISYTFGDQFWKFYGSDEIEAIENDLSLDGFKKALQRYWRLHNPPTNWEQLRKYGSTTSPGDELTLLDGVKPEELCTIAGRKRVSKIFRRNTDKLQRRVNLVRQRRHPAG
jgi:hypothetical protein